MGAISTTAVTAEKRTERREAVNNGTGNGHTRAEWLCDPLAALAGPRGPYTLGNADGYLDQEAVELYNGWLVWQEMTDTKERAVVGTIQSMLDLSARKAAFGQMLPDQAECLLRNGDVIKPDACLISWERLERAGTPQGPNDRILLTECPELVIESRSSSNWRKQEAMKHGQYFANGTEVVWDVDEPNRIIDVYHATAPNSPIRYAENDEIICEFIPNWRRLVADIFADHASAEVVAGEVAIAWREEGVEAGIEIGEARGMATGRIAGELVARRQNLLLILQHKFGPLPDPVIAQIKNTIDPAQFDQWLLQAMMAENLSAMDW